MPRSVVLGALALVVLGGVMYALTRSPDPDAKRAAHVATDEGSAAPPAPPTHAPPPRPPQLDVPARAAEVPVEGPTASIHGRLTERGKPVAGFRIELLHSAPHADTDANGEFRLDGLPLGEHEVVAEDRKTARGVHKEVELAAGDDLELDLALLPASRLHIEVVDRDGAPVPGAEVVVLGPAGRQSYFIGDNVTDEHGAIDRFNIGPGPILIGASAGGERASLDQLVRGTDDHARLQLATKGGYRIGGTVHDDLGAPVAGATMNLEGRRATTDGAGRFVFDRVLEGSHALLARLGPEPRYGGDYLSGADDRAIIEHVQAGTVDAELVLPRMGTLDVRFPAGTTFDAVHVSGPGPRSAVLRASDGRVPPTPLVPQAYHFIAENPGHVLATGDAILVPGETTIVQLASTPPGTLRVHATKFPHGEPAAGFVCHASMRARATADEAGVAMLAGLPPGSVDVGCWLGAAGGYAKVVTVTAGATVDTNLQVVDSPELFGRHYGAELDRETLPPSFAHVTPAGPAAAAGIADGDQLLAIDGVTLTADNVGAARAFVDRADEPFTARIRPKTGSYAIDLNVRPR